MKLDIFNSYVQKVCKLYQVDEKDLFTKTKVREVVDARHLLYYLCRNRPMKLKYIQTYMSERGYDVGHSSINHGVNMVTKFKREDEDYKKLLVGLQEIYE